jgi:hypothetical protein
MPAMPGQQGWCCWQWVVVCPPRNGLGSMCCGMRWCAAQLAVPTQQASHGAEVCVPCMLAGLGAQHNNFGGIAVSSTLWVFRGCG